MKVYVYSCSKKQGYYVYLPEEDNFDAVPESLRSALGKLSPALVFTVHPDMKLAKENPASVIENIKNQGFHLQISEPLIDLQAKIHFQNNKI